MITEQTMREHHAWLDVGDIEPGGKDNDLHNAIVRWGEELATLRFIQPPDMARRALDEKRELYPGRDR